MGLELCPRMHPKKGDLVVKGKSRLCSFASSNLDFLLSQNNINNVMLGRFLTDCCIESMMHTAYEKGYKVYTLNGCVAATSKQVQYATLEYNFGMFSVPMTSKNVLAAIIQSSVMAA
jgi:nicotinamidase-related amidase